MISSVRHEMTVPCHKELTKLFILEISRKYVGVPEVKVRVTPKYCEKYCVRAGYRNKVKSFN